MPLDQPGPGAGEAERGETVGAFVLEPCAFEALAALFKALGHDGRLRILYYLSQGEKSVTELEGLLGQRQAAVSQQLARLRLEGLVETRRDGKSIYYSVNDPRAKAVLRLLPELRAAQGA